MRQLLKITTTFALALVFTAGMAFGQDSDDRNRATVDQDGNGSEATVTQTLDGDKGFNTANVFQRNGAQTATIRQTTPSGDGNSKALADVQQLGSGGNDALVDQTRRRGAKAFLKQNGQDNDADVAQTGGDVLRGYDGANTSRGSERALQVGIANELKVFQGRDPANFDNVTNSFHEARVTQDGNYNDGFIEQQGQGAEANLLQDGGLNEATIIQGSASSGNNSNGVLADVQQLGVGNEATVTQFRKDSEAFILQDGSSNFVDAFQNVGSGASDVGHTLDVNQYTDNNFVKSTQTGKNHTATINQGQTP